MSQSLETRVEIAAPPEIVWEVLTDTNAFPEWTDADLEKRARTMSGSRTVE